ncbi:S-adenosyl-L-methionine-dependent methyltransferase [Hypoxylon rubiginosum]|uniref:S-adenosyl-L-methionine-dependent methyltransferase n=1 Tax=Hypoxylon rubiginosum TaxID=110542 RepID=A0ACB9Z1A9_9PEZI|nr:S-adenosyl-L-methionine-dependent methyltransferase [Hypoxylon rubiginosum]
MADHSFLIQYLSQPREVDDETRFRLISACQDVIESLEPPLGTARRHSFLLLDQAVIRAAIQLDIFSLLVERGVPCTTEQLAASTTPSCDAAVLSRLLRYLVSPLRLVKEEGRDLWSVTRPGRVYADPKFKSSVTMYFDACGPAFLALPKWLCTTPTDRAVTAFKAAHPDEEGFFSWLQKDDAKLQAFHTWMGVLKTYQFDSLDTIDFNQWMPDDIPEDEVAFVDIGGGTGNQCVAVRKNRGSRPGRIINQDRKEVVESARGSLEEMKVETIAHDFFAEQPIQGARIYHFRQIFHNWPDKDCVKILERTREAMSPSSTLLIDEVVLPETGAHWMATQRDLNMTALFNAKERTESQWRELLSQAHFRVVGVHCYDKKQPASLIEAKKE